MGGENSKFFFFSKIEGGKALKKKMTYQSKAILKDKMWDRSQSIPVGKAGMERLHQVRECPKLFVPFWSTCLQFGFRGHRLAIKVH